MPLTSVQLRSIISEISELVLQRYILEPIAQKYSLALRVSLEAGGFTTCHDINNLAKAIHDTLYHIYPDLHLKLKPRGQNTSVSQSQGITEAKFLENRIAYLDIHSFTGTGFSADLHSAMASLRTAEAFIIDLRKNRGGLPENIQLLSSYFFSEPVWLNSIFYRYRNEKLDYWTDPAPAPFQLDKTPLYVLISANTFSAGEECAYNFQQLKRGMLIGQKTMGAAHPTEKHIIQNSIYLYLPVGRSINPISKTNWEGRGVIPNIETTSGQELIQSLQLISA